MARAASAISIAVSSESMTIKLLCAGTALLLGCAVDEATSVDQTDVETASTFTVHGTGTTYGHSSKAIATKPMDLSADTFASDSLGHHDIGAGTANGTFDVPVQTGAHSWDLETDLGFGSPYLVVGDALHPNVSQHVLGRLDGVAPTTETDVTIGASGLDAWADGDETELMVANNGDIVYAPEAQFAMPPDDGDTTASGTIDWDAQFPPTVLVDAATGDIAGLEQLVVRTSGTEAYQALDRYGTAPKLTQTDGEPSAMSFALHAVSQETHALHWRGAAFEAMSSEVGAGAADLPGGQAVFVDALPDAAQFGFYTSAPDLAIYTPSVVSSNLDLTLHYGNPYAWDEFYSLNYYFAAPIALGDAAPATEFVGYVANLDVDCTRDGVIAPQISPVRDVEIGSGASPTISWSPPAIGRATQYFVELQQVSASDGQTVTTVLADFVTTTRSLHIPADLIPTGSTYLLVISAVNFGDVDRTVSLFGDGLPFEQAIMVTPTFAR
jgi:hypothetical protein